MSFSSKTKNELSRIKSEDKCCMLAQLSAILRVSGSINLQGLNKLRVDISTENASSARLIFTLFKKSLGIQTEIIVKKNHSLKKTHTYVVTLGEARPVLEELGIISFEKGYFEIVDKIPEKFIEKQCCIRAYARGIFVGGGSVSDPEKGYHLEFVTHSQGFAEEFSELLNSTYNLNSKVIVRKNSYIVYLKEGDQIVDLLNVIGAHNALMDFENVRIVKQVRNQVNRLVNCETANLNKTVDAAHRQVQNILYIKDTVGLDYLPDNLIEIARLRLENREASLVEIGQLLSKSVGKSGVNHRFKKIEKIADEIRERNEE